MTASEVFYKRAKDAIRRGEGKGEDEIANDIRDALFVIIQDLPSTLQHDIFNFYYDLWLEKDDEGKNLYQLAEMPLKLIDFIKGQLTSSEVEFSDDEWAMIRDGINACADSMDIRLLNQLMTILVEKKRY